METLSHYQQRINLVLAEQIQELAPSTPQRLKDAIAYSILDAGKRLRPSLTYAVGEALGVAINQLDAPAAAVELIHCYSLVHDDLPAMDDDDLRRGKATTHIAYDEATAILVGDALQTLAFDIIANAADLSDKQKVMMIQVLAQAAGANGMVAGQVRDMQAENSRINLTDLHLLHQQKTGALIVAAILLAAHASANISEIQYQALYDYGQHLGLAFQIQDDVLDATQTAETLGKPAGSDERNQKSTFVSLLGLAGAQQAAQQSVAHAKQALDKANLTTPFLQELTDYILSRQH